MEVTLYLLAPLIILLLLGQHIAFALLLSAFLGYYFLLGGPLPRTIGITSFNLTYNFVLTAIPLFILHGRDHPAHGVQREAVSRPLRWFQLLPGGLLHSNIAACGLFSAVSGSSVATAAAIGTVALPELEQRKYDGKLSTGSLAAGGTLGPLIPPEHRVHHLRGYHGDLDRPTVHGRVFPGLLLAGLFMAYIAMRVVMNPSLVPAEERVSWMQRLRGTIEIVPIVCLMVVVLGGIYAGVMTPTEAAAVGAFGALVMAAALPDPELPVLRDALIETARATAFIMFIIVGAMLLGVVLANLRIPGALADMVLAAPAHAPDGDVADLRHLLLHGNLLRRDLHDDHHPAGNFPVVVALGYNPVWFGVAFVIIMEVGLLTPPVGLNLYVIHGIAKHRPFSEVAIGSAPFFMAMLVALAIVHAVPALSLWAFPRCCWADAHRSHVRSKPRGGNGTAAREYVPQFSLGMVERRCIVASNVNARCRNLGSGVRSQSQAAIDRRRID